MTRGKALNISDASIIEKTVGTWIIKQRVEPEVDAKYGFLDNNTRLGKGEKEAIKLCKHLDAAYFIADDGEARRVSRMLNIKPVGTCGTVVQAYGARPRETRDSYALLLGNLGKFNDFYVRYQERQVSICKCIISSMSPVRQG